MSIINDRAVIENSVRLDENTIRNGVKLLAHGLNLCNSTDFISFVKWIYQTAMKQLTVDFGKPGFACVHLNIHFADIIQWESPFKSIL